MSTLPARILTHVEATPAREVFRLRDLTEPEHPERALTYAELWALAGRYGRALAGVQPGERVVIVLPLGPELLAAHLGAMLQGAVPSLHSHPSAKTRPEAYARSLTHALATLRPRAVITQPAFREPVLASGVAADAVVLAPADPGPPPEAWRAVAPDQVALVQHSSGSTGLQKGVALTHAMVLGQCASYAQALDLGPDDRIGSWLPLYHDMGLFTSWLLPALHGVPVCALDPFAWVADPASFVRLLSDHRVTLAWQPNFAYPLLAERSDAAALAGLDLSALRGLTNCAEPVRAESHRRLLERLGPCGLRADALWVCYAMAENAFAVTAAGGPRAPAVETLRVDAAAFAAGRYAPGDGHEVVSVGAAIPQVEVRVADATGEALPDDAIGELLVRSPFTLREYLGNPEATAAALRDGWYHTGDLGFAHDGQLYVTGRRKDLLIVGGRNFYPQDLEHLADQCAGAIPGRSAAVGVDDAQQGTQRVVVLVESHDPAGAGGLPAALRQAAFEQLDCPLAEVRVVPHMWLPKTTSGKIARQAAKQRYLDAFAAPAPSPDAEPAPLGTAAFAACCLFVAAVAWLALALAPNPSWGIYAGF